LKSSGGDAAVDPERARIAAALVVLCAVRGYRETTLQQLLDRAGVDLAAFHRHFDDLEDCFCATYQEFALAFFQRAAAAFAAASGWREQIRAVAYELLDFFKEDSERAQFVLIEILYAGPRAQLAREQSMQMLYVLIDRGREQLADPGSVPEELAATIGGGIYNRIRMQLTAQPDNPARWDPIVPELMYSVVEPYLGTEAALEELTMPRPPRPPGPARR
jgi:AcrR family transcriptional regulator